MNTLPNSCIMVVNISDNFIETVVTGCDNVKKIQQLGFSGDKDRLSKNISNENEKLSVINELISADALFCFGYGWYPSEIMADYTQKGIINRPYKIIAWTNKTTYLIEERN